MTFNLQICFSYYQDFCFSIIIIIDTITGRGISMFKLLPFCTSHRSQVLLFWVLLSKAEACFNSHWEPFTIINAFVQVIVIETPSVDYSSFPLHGSNNITTPPNSEMYMKFGLVITVAIFKRELFNVCSKFSMNVHSWPTALRLKGTFCNTNACIQVVYQMCKHFCGLRRWYSNFPKI